MTKKALKHVTRDDTEHGKDYYLASDVDALLAQPVQEPLEYWNAVEGWVKIDEVREHFDSVGCGTIYKTAGEGREPLYTSPPQRTWVGLTDEEYEEIWRMDLNNKELMDKTITKLKDKNT